VATGSRETTAAVRPQAPDLGVIKIWERHFQPANHLPQKGHEREPFAIATWLVGENINRSAVSITCVECQVSNLVKSNTCPLAVPARGREAAEQEAHRERRDGRTENSKPHFTK
jgi:hypothetical protein